MTAPPPPPDSLRDLFQEVEIRVVWLVDDAYRPPHPDEFGPDAFEAFYARAGGDGLLDALDDVLGAPDVTFGQLEDDACARLWAEVGRGTPLGELAAPLFASRTSKLKALRPLEERLEALGVTVSHRGDVPDDDECDAASSPQLVFLDWYLGDDTAPAAVDAAVRAARNVYRTCSIRREPVIVLMSSSSKVGDASEQFRDRSELLRGMFYAIDKPRFADATERDAHLRLYARSLPAGREVQRMHGEIGRAGRAAVAALQRRLRELTLSDYAHIQRLSLQDDGQPLGEYVFWLFSAALGHELFGKRLAGTREQLDGMTFADALPTLEQPSAQLAKIYSNALFDLTPGPLENHPRAHAGARLSAPLLTLGDVYGAASNADVELYLVINAQCDLQFAPGAKRAMPPDRSILLLPGHARPLSEPLADEEKELPRTELFIHPARRREPRRLVWHPKRVTTRRYDEITRWLGRRGLTRLARLRLPYALELQHAFAADLTRVGMPVAPPIYRNVAAALHYHGQDGLSLVGASEAWASLVLTRTGDQCVVTLACVRECRAELDRVIAEHNAKLLAAEPAAAPAGVDPATVAAGARASRKDGEGAKRALAKAEEFRAQSAWFDLLKPFQLKVDKPTTPVQGLSFVVTKRHPPPNTNKGSFVLVLDPVPSDVAHGPDAPSQGADALPVPRVSDVPNPSLP